MDTLDASTLPMRQAWNNGHQSVSAGEETAGCPRGWTCFCGRISFTEL